MQLTEVCPSPSELASNDTPEHEETSPNTGLYPLKRPKVELPFDIVLSLLRPNELEKLRKYVAAYRGQHWRS